MSYSRNDPAVRDLLPFGLTLAVPLAICILVILVEPGIERAFLWASIKMAVILVTVGLALSFVASRLASRTDRTDGSPRA